MIDDSVRELINKDIDGVCTPEEASRLQGILRTSGEARRIHDDLRLLAFQLGAITPVEPPRTLKPAVLRAINVHRRPAATTGAVAAWFGGLTFRPLVAAAAGAVAGIALTIAVSSALSPSTVTDEDLTGTLILHGSTASFTPGPVTRVKEGEASATIHSDYSNGLCFLKLSVSSPAGVSAALRVDPAVVRFEGIRPLGTPPPSVTFEDGEVLMESTQAGGIAVLVAGNEMASQAGRLTLSVNGKVFYDEEIVLGRK